MSGTKGHSGRRRKATCARNGRISVNLDMVSHVSVNGHSFGYGFFVNSPKNEWWIVDEKDRFTDYAAAAAEFVRRVNG